MTHGEYTDKEGYTYRVYSTMYVDWGLEISQGDKTIFYNPSALSNESYGWSPNPDRYEDWDEAMDAAGEGDDEAFVAWTAKEWSECLESEADDLLDAYTDRLLGLFDE